MERHIIQVREDKTVDSVENLQPGHILLFETFNSKSLITRINEDNTLNTIGRRTGWGREWINEFKLYVNEISGNYQVDHSIMDMNRVYYKHRGGDKQKYLELNQRLIGAGL